ncbi:Phosphatidylinositol 4-phosphate 5-kinase 5 [Hibiscus syriacus]|uniref:1-phosphatidylinositol-4-phosphate 5-kinase n=1 Tax=Hibiscus syriacus TaxID=106335 RepID=A0A6A2YVU8_HIBSY|nr:Phosphatidylinositol 4-phosphate 5-kinase 5 [Hibiscus syriacus]
MSMKRQGQTVSRGHKNYELMLNLQHGIRHSVGRQGPAITLELKSTAFDPKEKVWTKIPPEGSKHTPTLRKLFDVDAVDYMLSLCTSDTLRELSSPVRFIIIRNLFCSDYAIHQRFDLKGSFQGRTTAKPESELDPTTTLKDLDLNYIFRLPKLWFQEFCRQVNRDCDFLECERIMDYSLLVALYFSEVPTRTGNGDCENGEAPQISQSNNDHLVIDTTRQTSDRLGIKIAAQSEKTERKTDYQLVGESTGVTYNVILFFGIMDIIQDYDISKKLEHVYKSMQYDPTSTSAIDPKLYSKRFRDFIFKTFNYDQLKANYPTSLTWPRRTNRGSSGHALVIED